MENRNFQLDTEWNIIHYPEKPTGFGILIIGDERHFVDEQKSFWIQNEGKLAMINQLKEAGYTIFSSNLYGRNWGSDKAAELALRLYQHVQRSEILNGKIHLLAEGMGALVAVKLLEKMNGQLRSVVLLNPLLSLKHHLEQEKEHKFFYKKLVKELEDAFQQDVRMLEKELQKSDTLSSLKYGLPIKMIHVLSGGRSYSQAKLNQFLLKKDIEDHVVQTSFILPEKKQQLGSMIVKFCKKYEKEL